MLRKLRKAFKSNLIKKSTKHVEKFLSKNIINNIDLRKEIEHSIEKNVPQININKVQKIIKKQSKTTEKIPLNIASSIEKGIEDGLYDIIRKDKISHNETATIIINRIYFVIQNNINYVLQEKERRSNILRVFAILLILLGFFAVIA